MGGVNRSVVYAPLPEFHTRIDIAIMFNMIAKCEFVMAACEGFIGAILYGLKRRSSRLISYEFDGAHDRHSASGLLQRLIQIPPNIFNVFQPHAQAHEVRCDARGGLLIGRELAVGGAGWMDRQALRIADIGEMAE